MQNTDRLYFEQIVKTSINRNFREKNKISDTLHVFEQTRSQAIINGAVMKSFKTYLG